MNPPLAATCTKARQLHGVVLRGLQALEAGDSPADHGGLHPLGDVDLCKHKQPDTDTFLLLAFAPLKALSGAARDLEHSDQPRMQTQTDRSTLRHADTCLHTEQFNTPDGSEVEWAIEQGCAPQMQGPHRDAPHPGGDRIQIGNCDGALAVAHAQRALVHQVV